MLSQSVTTPSAVLSDPQPLIHIDFETRSLVDLPTYGLDKYAKDPSTEVICMAYSVGGSDPIIWLPESQPIPDFLTAPDSLFAAHNAAFEVNILRHVLGIPVRWEQFTDTMAMCAASNVPQSLEEAAMFLGLAEQKDATGKRLIQKLSKPDRKGGFNKDPVLLAQMYEYCKTDVKVEHAIFSTLRPLDASEQAVWVLTQQINDRGVPVDPMELQRAIAAVEINKAKIRSEITLLTGGLTANQPAKIAEWLSAANIKVDDLTAETVAKLLARKDIPDKISRVLELRRQGSLTSTAKYEKMLEVQVGGRIRNTLVYHGASTGRFASRGGLNLQNLARPHLEGKDLDAAVGRVLVDGVGGTMDELSSLVRSVIKAPPGYLFVDCDFSSVENRVASWIAGQKDKVENFKAGLDEYKAFASKSLYHVPYEEVTKEMRQVAKSAVLGCVFGQGAQGLMRYAEGMGVNITQAQSEQAVKAYREDYFKVKEAWYSCEQAAIEAINVPGVAVRSGKLLFKVAKGALWLRLPSGRLICWRDAKLERKLTPWGELRDGVTVVNQNTFSRRWGRNQIYGSSLFQSAVQGTARDILTFALGSLNDKGLDIILSVHDEILCLSKESEAKNTEALMLEVMSTSPPWAPDLPLAAESWIGARYRK